MSITLNDNDNVWPNGADNSGNNAVLGLGGNDTIDGGPGDDFCPGGASFETVVAAAHP